MMIRKNHPYAHEKALDTSLKEVVKNIFWIFAILLLFYFSVRYIGTEDIHEKVASFGIFGPLILIFLKISTLVFAPLGGLPIYLVAGALFGFAKGFTYILVGDIIGSTISFYISRIYGKKIATYFLSKQGMVVANDVIEHMGTTKGFVQARFIFLGFPEAVNYGAGLTKISYFKFISITILIGIIPVALLVGFGDVIIRNFNTSSLIMLNISLVLIVILGVLWFYLQTQKNKNK